MNKVYLIITFTVLLCTFTSAQQVPFYNHNIINPFVYNPSMAGASGDINAYVVRSQRYMGYGTGATSNFLTLEGEFFIPNSGFGMQLNQNSIGLMQQVSASLSYSYHLKINETNDLRFGVSGGYLDNKINVSDIDVAQLDDPFLVGLQPNVGSYDFNLGATYAINKKTRIGLSVPQLIGNKVKYSKEDSRGYYALARHFMLSAEHDFRFFKNENIIIKPQVLTRYVPGAPFQYDITAHLNYKSLGWLSVTYKSDYAMQFNLGLHIKKNFHLGYSYEYITGSFRNYYSEFNHEFLVGYTFNSAKSKKVEVKVPDPKVIDENKKLQNELEERNQEIKEKDSLLEEEVNRRKKIEEELRKRLKELEEENEQISTEQNNEESAREEYIRDKKDVRLEEMDGSVSPNGYYVIIGAYSSKQNATRKVERCSDIFPNAYRVLDNNKQYYYVIIKYAKDKSTALKALEKYKRETGEKVWILRYI